MDAWKLFKKLYKQNDYVLVIDEFDKRFFGKMKYDDEGLHLTKIDGIRKYLYWDQIRFMCHDGFPVKKLLGADGSDTIELESPVDLNKLITYLSAKRLVFSDPYMIENVTSKYIQTYDGNFTEDILLLKSKDGAVGLLYDLNRIYYHEAL